MKINREQLLSDLEDIIVPLSFEGLDEEVHHCEYNLAWDRKRILDAVKEYLEDKA